MHWADIPAIDVELLINPQGRWLGLFHVEMTGETLMDDLIVIYTGMGIAIHRVEGRAAKQPALDFPLRSTTFEPLARAEFSMQNRPTASSMGGSGPIGLPVCQLTVTSSYLV